MGNKELLEILLVDSKVKQLNPADFKKHGLPSDTLQLLQLSKIFGKNMAVGLRSSANSARFENNIVFGPI
jgi:hypothetical protein